MTLYSSYYDENLRLNGYDYFLCGFWSSSPIKKDFAQKLLGADKLPYRNEFKKLNFVIL